MKFALALALLTAFTGYANAGSPYVPRVNQYVPKPVPGPGPCIQCGMQLPQSYNTVVNPAVISPAPNYTPTLANKSGVH